MYSEGKINLFYAGMYFSLPSYLLLQNTLVFVTFYGKEFSSEMLSINYIYRNMEEESIVENFIKAVEGTKSTVELVFDNLTIKLPGMNAVFAINGKVNVTARPVHERQ